MNHHALSNYNKIYILGTTKIVNVVNCSGVHVGPVFNYKFASNDECPKSNYPDKYVPRTNQINKLLESRTIVTRDHIGIISLHLGSSWRDIGSKLGYSKGELDNFFEDNKRTGLQEVW